MKPIIFYSVILFFISCVDSSQDVSVPLIEDNIKSSKEAIMDNFTYQDFLDVNVTKVNKTPLKSDSECPLLWEDIVTPTKCTVSHWVTAFPIPASILGVNCIVSVDYSTSHCFLGQNLQSITVADVAIDYDLLAQNCPNVQFPSNPGQLEALLLELERYVGEFVERLAFVIITSNSNFNTDCAQTNSVAVTRINASCFQFCMIPPADPLQLYGPTKVYCGSDICCFKTSTYCTDENGNLVIQEGLQWSTGSSCDDLDCENPNTDCSHDCSVVF